MVLAQAATAPVAVIANLGGMHGLRFQRLDHAQVVTVQAEMHAWRTTKMRVSQCQSMVLVPAVLAQVAHIVCRTRLHICQQNKLIMPHFGVIKFEKCYGDKQWVI